MTARGQNLAPFVCSERSSYSMATTRIISMHINKGKTIAQCLTDRTDYTECFAFA